ERERVLSSWLKESFPGFFQCISCANGKRVRVGVNSLPLRFCISCFIQYF
ncbi:unnamed protein product, partial (mitochondrion) [Musa textilis]